MDNRKILMALTVDVDQVTKALNYKIKIHSDDVEENDVLVGEGPYAGTYHFHKWDEIYMKVIAYSRKEEKVQLTITDCTLACIPTMPVETEFLSLFDKHRACIHVTDWGIPVYRRRGRNKNDICETSALHPLVVWADKGQWQISGYLSVLIERTIEGETKQFRRLFYFDPEGSVGSGGDIEQ